MSFPPTSYWMEPVTRAGLTSKGREILLLGAGNASQVAGVGKGAVTAEEQSRES